jgi:glycosyltransferase involved in cell wall biosynthesis
MRFRFFLERHKISSIKFSHSHTAYPSAYISEDLKCKKIIQHHGLDVFQINNGRIKLIRNIQKSFLIKKTTKILNAADLNIGVSRLVLKNMYNYSDYIPKREFVLYNGVDLSKFFKKSSHKNVIFTIGCIGNFSKTKGQIYLIKSVQKIIECGKKINLRLIGSGSTLQLCKTYVFEHKLSEYIFFENEISHNKLNNFYNAIDLFVLPSYYEALGCVYLESWATETPFIAIIDQGISELIPARDKNRILALKQSVVSLQEKILLVFDERHDYPFNDKYNIKNTISEYLKHPLFYAE